MTTVLLVGQQQDLDTLVKSEISKSYGITYTENTPQGTIIERSGTGYEILIVSTEKLDSLRGFDECVVVMKMGGKLPVTVGFPEKTIFIASSDEIEQLETLRNLGKNVITCGVGKRDTVSYTSLTDNGIVVSLNREISAFSGKKISPLEFPEKRHGNFIVYDELAVIALRLVLDDYNSDIGIY
jgi:hypothetical protein